MSDKVIDIYEWHRPRTPGELPRGCAIPYRSTETSEQPRKMKPSEISLAIASIALFSLLIASFV